MSEFEGHGPPATVQTSSETRVAEYLFHFGLGCRWCAALLSVLGFFLIGCHVRCVFLLFLRPLGFMTDSCLFPLRFQIVSESFPTRFLVETAFPIRLQGTFQWRRRFRLVSTPISGGNGNRFRFVPDLPPTAHSRDVSSLLLARFFIILWKIDGFSWEVLVPANLTYDFIWEVFRFTILTYPFTACWEDPAIAISAF